MRLIFFHFRFELGSDLGLGDKIYFVMFELNITQLIQVSATNFKFILNNSQSFCQYMQYKILLYAMLYFGDIFQRLDALISNFTNNI